MKHEEPELGRPSETSQWPHQEEPAENRPGDDLRHAANIFSEKSEQEEHAGSASTNYDEQLSTAVKEALTQDALLDPSDIIVSVSKGVVSLDGTVDSEGDRQRAGECVYNVEGVSSCNNNLTIAVDQH